MKCCFPGYCKCFANFLMTSDNFTNEFISQMRASSCRIFKIILLKFHNSRVVPATVIFSEYRWCWKWGGIRFFAGCSDTLVAYWWKVWGTDKCRVSGLVKNDRVVRQLRNSWLEIPSSLPQHCYIKRSWVAFSNHFFEVRRGCKT
jgi:hypothetical protein